MMPMFSDRDALDSGRPSASLAYPCFSEATALPPQMTDDILVECVCDHSTGRRAVHNPLVDRHKISSEDLSETGPHVVGTLPIVSPNGLCSDLSDVCSDLSDGCSDLSGEIQGGAPGIKSPPGSRCHAEGENLTSFIYFRLRFRRPFSCSFRCFYSVFIMDI